MTTNVRRLPDALKVKATLIPERIAHDDTRRLLSMRDWDREADQVAGGLVSAGLRPGERVWLAITNRHAVEMAIAVIAAMRAGGIAVPVNTRLSDLETRSYARLIEPRFAITDLEKHFDMSMFEKAWDVGVMPRDTAALPDQSKLDSEADALILGTSGTTGQTKGVVISHLDLAARLGDGTMIDQHGNATLHALPFTGSGGMLGECLLPIQAGVTCYTQPVFDAGGFLRLVEEKRPTTVYFVPTMLRLVLDHPDAGRADFSSVRYMLTGTAPLPHDSVVRAHNLWPHVSLRNSYGMSEGGVGTSTRSKASVLKPGCVGRLPDNMQIRDPEGNLAASGVIGEIYGYQKYRRRYWRDDAATQAGWVKGWTRSGDLGFVDADGDLILAGRAKELIIRGGYNISPVEIENALHSHPGVKHAAVVGVSHEVLGEDIAAAVVAQHEGALTADDLKLWCREHLADNKIPRTILFVSQLPMNQNGKVMKRELKPELQLVFDQQRRNAPA